MKKSTIHSYLIVIVVELYSMFVTFFLAPLLASSVDDWFWISFVSIALIVAHFFVVLMLRYEKPTVWIVGCAFNVVAIIIMCNLNISILNEGLLLYGITPANFEVPVEKITSFPYYVDALLYSVLLFSLREFFAIPVCLFTQSNSFDKKTNTKTEGKANTNSPA